MIKIISDYRKKKLKEYETLVKQTFVGRNKLNTLKKRAAASYSKIFKGVWVMSGISVSVSINFGQNEPCLVGVYKDDGAEESVKPYSCPYYDSQKPCSESCKYRHRNNKYLKLVNETIPKAKEDYKMLVRTRQATLRQVLFGNENA